MARHRDNLGSYRLRIFVRKLGFGLYVVQCMDHVGHPGDSIWRGSDANSWSILNAFQDQENQLMMGTPRFSYSSFLRTAKASGGAGGPAALLPYPRHPHYSRCAL